MRWILVVTALIALTLAVFALWPGLDLAVAHVFYDRGGFIGHDGLERFGRDVFRVAPFVVLAAYIALYALRRAGVAVVLGADRARRDLPDRDARRSARG